MVTRILTQLCMNNAMPREPEKSKIMETAKSSEIWDLVTSITIKDNEYILTLDKEEKSVYLGKATDLTNMMMYVKVPCKMSVHV